MGTLRHSAPEGRREAPAFHIEHRCVQLSGICDNGQAIVRCDGRARATHKFRSLQA